jgi:flagellar protein FlbT
MKSSLRISLKAGERIFINGAVLRVDRKVALEFLNDVTFLLENHVLQPEQATTPLRQLYFIVQMMLINPKARNRR